MQKIKIDALEHPVSHKKLIKAIRSKLPDNKRNLAAVINFASEKSCKIDPPTDVIKLSAGWRLPTREELKILNDNMDAIGGFDSSSWYWSSTEHSIFFRAWIRSFSDCHEFYGGKLKAGRVRCARSESFNNLIISKNAPIGERFDLNGEEVVFGGIDKNGLALIVAASDEPGPRGNYKMNWTEAMKVAKMKNQQAHELDKMPELNIDEILDRMPVARDYLKILAPELREEVQRELFDVIQGAIQNAIQTHQQDQEPQKKPKLPRM